MENPLRIAVWFPRVTLGHWGMTPRDWTLWLGMGWAFPVPDASQSGPPDDHLPAALQSSPNELTSTCAPPTHFTVWEKCRLKTVWVWKKPFWFVTGAFLILCLISLSLDREKKWLLGRVSDFFIYSYGAWCVYDHGTQWIVKKKEEGNQREKKTQFLLAIQSLCLSEGKSPMQGWGLVREGLCGAPNISTQSCGFTSKSGKVNTFLDFWNMIPSCQGKSGSHSH